jgi:hypothetical protein
MRELRCHKSIDTISIYRLNAIRESIVNGNPEFGHLTIFNKNDSLPELTDKQKVYLESVYLDMLKEIPEISTELISAYRAYYESYIKAKIELNRNELKSLRGEDIKTSFAKCNKLFNDYINILNRDNTDFQIIEYYISDDIKDLFKEQFPNINYPPDFDIIKKEITAFHSIDRYVYEVSKLKVSEEFKRIFLSERFLEYFVKSKIVIIEDLTLYTDRLSEDFKLSDNYQGFIDFRHKALSLQNMAFEPINNYDFFEEVANLKQILGFDFDVHSTSAREYYSYLKIARAKIARETKKDNSV